MLQKFVFVLLKKLCCCGAYKRKTLGGAKIPQIFV